MPVTGLPPRHFLRGARAKCPQGLAARCIPYRLAPNGGSLKEKQRIFPLMPVFQLRTIIAFRGKKINPADWAAGLKMWGLIAEEGAALRTMATVAA